MNHEHEWTLEALHHQGADPQTEITTEVRLQIPIDHGHCPGLVRQGRAGAIPEPTRPGQGPRGGAVGGEIMKTVMGLGREVRVTAAIAAIAVVAEAGHGRTGREDKDRWERV